MTQHTPGPWYYTKTPIVGFVVRSSTAKSDNGRDKFIADCGKVHHTPFDPEYEANAALIAAAPDLIEALKETREALEIVCRVVKMEHIAELDIAERADIKARAAIAKAEAQS